MLGVLGMAFELCVDLERGVGLCAFDSQNMEFSHSVDGLKLLSFCFVDKCSMNCFMFGFCEGHSSIYFNLYFVNFIGFYIFYKALSFYSLYFGLGYGLDSVKLYYPKYNALPPKFNH